MDNNSETSDNKDETSSNGKKELPPHLQKICLVCGDKAFGYNFNAISCESCKAFFRRNALASKEFKCPFTNNCDITVITRRFCQKCRLEKCLAIGMVKEFIMSEEDKAEKRKKIQENKAKKRQHGNVDEQVSSSKIVKTEEETTNRLQKQNPNMIQYEVLNSTTCSPNPSVQSPLNSEIDSSIQSPTYNNYYMIPQNDYSAYPISEEPPRYIDMASMTDKSVQYDSSFDQYTMSSMDSDYEEKQNSIKSILTPSSQPQSHVCPDLLTTTSNPDENKARDILQDVERIEPNSMESILCEAIKLEFEAYTSVNQCNRSSRELNEVERAKLNELIVANKALNAPIDEDITQLIGGAEAAGFKQDGKQHHPELITIVNLTAVAIRRLIKMSKRISAFRNMCEADQVALLKGGCTEMMVLRSTMTYDNQGNSWKIPHTQLHNIKTDVLKLAKGNIYRSHMSFITSFDPRWRTDENIILVMSAILLFTPDRSHVVHKDVIKLEQNSYYYLLRRYLESVYPGCEAKSTFLKLIQKILELRKLAEEVTGVYLDVNPIEPLLMEIFDLKHHTV